VSEQITRLDLDDMRPDLAEALRPRVERLGYLGEFFRVAAHQPDALLAFYRYTDVSKQGLDKRYVELIALTVAAATGNAYERNQHERLSVRLDLGRDWVAEVERLAPEVAELDPAERVVQRYVLAAIADHGRGSPALFEAVVTALGAAPAVAVLLVVGRYLLHGLVVNTLALAPPVPSIFEDGFGL
jgi:alkylhydroperoxidase family enzyme